MLGNNVVVPIVGIILCLKDILLPRGRIQRHFRDGKWTTRVWWADVQLGRIYPAIEGIQTIQENFCLMQRRHAENGFETTDEGSSICL